MRTISAIYLRRSQLATSLCRSKDARRGNPGRPAAGASSALCYRGDLPLSALRPSNAARTCRRCYCVLAIAFGGNQVYGCLSEQSRGCRIGHSSCAKKALSACKLRTSCRLDQTPLPTLDSNGTAVGFSRSSGGRPQFGGSRRGIGRNQPSSAVRDAWLFCSTTDPRVSINAGCARRVGWRCQHQSRAARLQRPARRR